MFTPETDLEERIMSDPEFVCGLSYGNPRPGHPEGTVLAHIPEVLKNVDKYSTGLDRERLRLIALIHDTFKYKVDRSKPKTGPNHHGFIARKFAERYIQIEPVLEIIETHDEAFLAFRKLNRDRALRLIDRLGRNLYLYLLFFRCDNETGDKTPDSVEWFLDIVYGNRQ